MTRFMAATADDDTLDGKVPGDDMLDGGDGDDDPYRRFRRQRA